MVSLTELLGDIQVKQQTIKTQYLNEIMYAEPSQYSYPTLMSSFIQYLLSKGIKLKSLPKIKFIKNDVENSNNFFGKTAYYDPKEKLIVLYTLNRHPKDVMRSFAHEMIHHIQNLENRLNNIATQNTNEGGDLPEIEREAYEKGNMLFRNWEDSMKNSSLSESKYNKIIKRLTPLMLL